MAKTPSKRGRPPGLPKELRAAPAVSRLAPFLRADPEKPPQVWFVLGKKHDLNPDEVHDLWRRFVAGMHADTGAELCGKHGRLFDYYQVGKGPNPIMRLCVAMAENDEASVMEARQRVSGRT